LILFSEKKKINVYVQNTYKMFVENMATLHTEQYTGWSESLCAPRNYAFQQITPLSQHTSSLPHYLAQSDCLAADRQGQGHTRLTLTPSVIPNSNYIFMVGYWNCLKYFCLFFCTVIIRCTETFWSPCIYLHAIWKHKFII
jgi:hypothetical protein